MICINLDLENVGIELLDSHLIDLNVNKSGEPNNKNVGVEKKPLAHLALLKSALIYESFSDQSKLIDLVSSEILIIDITNTSGSRPSTGNANLFVNILCNSNTKPTDSVKRLQLELHYRSIYENYFLLLLKIERSPVVY